MSLCFVQFEVIQTQKRKPNNTNREPLRKATELKSNFLLILG